MIPQRKNVSLNIFNKSHGSFSAVFKILAQFYTKNL